MTGRGFTGRIRRARNVLVAERERTAAERDAFEAFGRRVGALSPQRLDRPEGPKGFARSLSAASSSPSPSTSMPDRVLVIYRETVVALSHYDEEYGEPAIENLAAEFGEEIGAAVARSGVFTAELKAALSSAAREAATRRGTFLDVLDEERRALDDAACELRRVGDDLTDLDPDSVSSGSSFTSLRDARERLCGLCERCEELVADRQETLRSPRAGGRWGRNDASLNEYLYASLDVTYPVLADASDAAATIRRERRRIERALTHAV